MKKRTRCSQNNTSSTDIFPSRQISLHHRVGTVLDGKEAPVNNYRFWSNQLSRQMIRQTDDNALTRMLSIKPSAVKSGSALLLAKPAF
jgi:hypothetical protein